MPNIKKAFALNLLRLRESLKLTQEQFAKLVGMSRPSIARYEAGESTTLETISKIASALNVEETDLIAPKLTPEDYKTFFDLTVAIEKLRKENEVLRNTPDLQISEKLSNLSDSEQEQLLAIISLLAALNEDQRGKALLTIQSITRTAALIARKQAQ